MRKFQEIVEKIAPKLRAISQRLDGRYTAFKEVVGTIRQRCREDKIGSGKIAILPLDECIRIRTGERGAKAIF